jgi:hypothetical protein
VEYSIDGGAWTDVRVYMSVYGGTTASPYEPFTVYLPFATSGPVTSMSFVSIPAQANALVQLRVTKLGNGPFQYSDHVAVRPTPKLVFPFLQGDGSVEFSTFTPQNFAGEQLVLWWDRNVQIGAPQQGLVFFLDPPYTAPSGPTVRHVHSSSDLANLTGIDTLDFESNIELPGVGYALDGPGAEEFSVPVGVNNIFLGAGSWVQGKLRFEQGGNGQVRRIYGPGVIDASRFNYKLRQCRNYSDPTLHSDGHQTVSFDGQPANPDILDMDGIIITDSNYASTDNLLGSKINNVKVIGWNGNNDGLQMANGTVASNVFIRTGDDSLELWGQSITVTNATVWQNNGGGVVNLGWSNKFTGDGNSIDGLFVIRTDWTQPTATPVWNVVGLNNQDNGVIVSLMTPGTSYGQHQQPVFRNIYVEEPPNVLFSLKILPPDCALIGLQVALGDGSCPIVDMTAAANVNLTIENVFTPQSLLGNSIGFQTLPKGFRYDYPAAGDTITEPADYPLHGTMNINLTNVFLKLKNGMVEQLTAENASRDGMIVTNNSVVNISYSFSPWALLQP